MRAKTQKCLLFSLALVALLPAPQAIAQDPAIRVRIELTTLYVISFHDDFSGLDMTGQAYGRMGFSFAGAGAPRPSLSVTMIWNRHECEPSIGTGCLISDSPPYTTDFGSHRSVNVSEMWLRQVWRTGGGETVLPFRQRNNLIDVKKSASELERESLQVSVILFDHDDGSPDDTFCVVTDSVLRPARIKREEWVDMGTTNHFITGEGDDGDCSIGITVTASRLP
jgi:hypothetical protein